MSHSVRTEQAEMIYMADVPSRRSRSPGRNPYGGTTPWILSLLLINLWLAIFSRTGNKVASFKKWETVWTTVCSVCGGSSRRANRKWPNERNPPSLVIYLRQPDIFSLLERAGARRLDIVAREGCVAKPDDDATTGQRPPETPNRSIYGRG